MRFPAWSASGAPERGALHGANKYPPGVRLINTQHTLPGNGCGAARAAQALLPGFSASMSWHCAQRAGVLPVRRLRR